MSVSGRLLGVDYGSVRIGLAVSDPERRLASPLAVYQRRGRQHNKEYFLSLVSEEEIVAFVVGLPIHLDGHEGQKAAEARAFGAWLAEISALPVAFWDERFTSVEAESALWQAGLTHKKRKARRDGVAAQLILQAYLDAGCPNQSAAGPLEG